MTSKPPLHRLTDVLRSTSSESLRRNAAELAMAAASLPPTDTATRFQRNTRLIHPKSLRLLCDAPTLSRWCVFAVYKPPFCPMRRVDAASNHHGVSVESFIAAALRSREVQPIMQGALHPSEVRVRVGYDIPTNASGPVVVTLADRHAFATSLTPVTMRWDVLVAGHAPPTEAVAIPTHQLFQRRHKPIHTANDDGHKKEEADGMERAGCSCSYRVCRNAYYATHPVSLMEFQVTAPFTPQPPQVESFVREELGSFVIGDPETAAMYGRGGRGGDQSARAAQSLFQVTSMRGDCDFPRVFTHLREVDICAEVPDASGGVAGTKVITFHCRNCFEPVLQRERVYSLKARRIGILDGSWTPDAEFL